VGACNIGTGTETTVIELADALRGLGDGAFTLEHAPARPGEVLRSAVDPSLARRVLGWEAAVGLAEGLERTLAGVRA
jgi:UDP-glucose 4-epimerase